VSTSRRGCGGALRCLLEVAELAVCFANQAATRAEDELLLLVRTSCGTCAALVVPVVPELRICRTLAAEYAGKPVLQLDLDDL
jgi:cytochrome c551/c552